MKKEVINELVEKIVTDVKKGKWIRIVGDLSSKNSAVLIVRNMVHSDINANVLYAGLSSKDFKKIIDLLYKEYGDEGIVINDTGWPHLQDKTIHLV